GVTDESNGLYFMRNRYYDPTTGRFTQKDPSGLSGGDGNLYRYVGNSPVQFIDPLGFEGDSVRATVDIVPDPSSDPSTDLPSVSDANSQLNDVLRYKDNNSGLYTDREKKDSDDFLNGLSHEAGFNRVPLDNALPKQKAPPTLNQKLKDYIERKNPNLKGKTRETSENSIISARESIPQRMADCMEFYIRLGYSLQDAYNKCKPLQTQDHITEQIASGDPNDLLGPPLYVRDDQTLPYTIDFENIPDASAPAQDVVITETLDSDLDLSTFQLGDIGFGSTTVTVPAGASSFSTRVSLPAADNTGGAALFVDITASLNFVTHIVTWQFKTVDPSTGDTPVNPLAGFLPANVTPPEGDGFVKYSVRPNAGLNTGVVIDSQATIVFDTNEAIDTPHITNTIDNGAPTSTVTVLAPTQDFPSFQVSWSGTDDAAGPTGSGIAFYDIYVSDNGGDFVIWLLNTTLTSAVYTGEVNHTYSFFSEATDNVGFEQEEVEDGQTSTEVLDVLFDFGDAPDPFFSTPGKYPTLLADDGARHKLGSGLYLGSGVDREFDGQPTATANGDDVTGVPDDEDGVVFMNLVGGSTGAATVTASLAGKLDAWIDFNRDGDWSDPGEQIATSLSLHAGSNNVSIAVPAGASIGNTFARFRLSSAGGLSVTGSANDGEVEDYQVAIGAPLITQPGGAVTWTKKQPPVSVLPQVSVPFSNLTNGVLTISINAIGSAKKSADAVTFPSFAALGTSTGSVYANGHITLQIQLNGSVTASAIQSFLRGITFSTKGKGLNTATRTMSVTLANSSEVSSTVTQTIHVVKKAPRAPRD
ncbi:MAG: repeat protein, partial [Planctomycetaceae bacterium]|nr:repeat protein [Planctomycetaceae bacterium]